MSDDRWTVNHVINRLGRPGVRPLPAPPYEPSDDANRRCRVGLAVESMKRHTSEEGWALFAGLQHAGYVLYGHNLGPSLTDVRQILAREGPSVVVVQDEREWAGRTAGPGFDFREQFTHVKALARRPDIFRVGVLKDAHQQPEYHRGSFDSFGAHAVVCYYHPRIVHHLAPYVRTQHLVRTHHCIDPSHLPQWRPSTHRFGAVISGALSPAYPLRQRLFKAAEHHELDLLAVKHPGYRRDGCRTPEYMKMLGNCKVSVCTSSIYGYTLRKLVESTAVGCRVITDLPEDDVMPGGLDRNLYRIRPDTPTRKVGEIIHDLLNSYDEELQKSLAEECAAYYDFRAVGQRLADDIERVRSTYQ